MKRSLKRELRGGIGDRNNDSNARADDTIEPDTDDSDEQGVRDRRVLRSRYLAVKNLIFDEKEGITSVDSDKFKSIFNQVESLHQKVQKPREQISDAEALLDITKSLVTSVRAQKREDLSVSDFVSYLLRDFGRQSRPGSTAEDQRNLISWRDIGVAVCQAFKSSHGFCTMVGPMSAEVKQRKVVHRKRVRPSESAQPEELEDTGTEKKGVDTDKNMGTVFNILRKHRRVRLENLILNRSSFAQTVENLFAVSFLAKDGRIEIKVDDRGYHFVTPRNAPASTAVAAGEVVYSHFVFRFDYNDWKLMTSTVKVGEELMPNRDRVQIAGNCETHPERYGSESTTRAATTPIRKLSRNRGLVLQKDSIVEDTPLRENNTERRAAVTRKGKRKIN